MTQPTLVEEVDILQVVPMSLLCDQLEQVLAYKEPITNKRSR